jgi:hypothetical protein
MADYNNSLINEILKNMSPEDAAQMGQAFQASRAPASDSGPIRTSFTPEEIKAAGGSPEQQIASGNIPTTGSLAGRSLETSPQSPNSMGPPAPNAQELAVRRAESTPASSSGNVIGMSSKTPFDMGRLNPLGTVPRGTDSGSVSDMIAKLNGQTDPALQAALSNRNNLQLFSMLGKSANQVLGGQTHTRPSDAVFDELGKQAGQGVEDIKNKDALTTERLKQQQLGSQIVDEQAKNDPHSSISNLYRASAEKMLHGKLPDNISAAQLEKVSPVFEKLYQAEQASLDRAFRLKEMDTFRNRTAANREDTSAQTTFDKNEGMFKQRILGANRLNDLVDRIKGGQLIGSKNVSRELTNEIDMLVRGQQNGGAYGDREEVAIRTLQGSLANLAQWALGHPENTIPEDFIPQIEKEAAILKHSYLKAYRDTADELQKGTSIQSKKDVYNNRSHALLGQQGVDYNSLESNKPQQTSGNYPQDVLDYAKDHNITPDQAQNVKNQRTQGN